MADKPVLETGALRVRVQVPPPAPPGRAWSRYALRVFSFTRCIARVLTGIFFVAGRHQRAAKKDIVHETPDFIGGFAVSAAEIPANDLVDVKQPFSLSEMTRTHTKPNKQLRAYGYKKVHALFYRSFSKNQKVTH